jgi:hypothetical protein
VEYRIAALTALLETLLKGDSDQMIHGINCSRTSFYITLWRHQLPLKVCYAMTANKAQGQSLAHVGHFLEPLAQPFSHGQLFVALSRFTNPANAHLRP